MKKKLLFINGHLNTGGVEKALLDVLKHLDYDRYEVDLLLLEELGDYAPELPAYVNVHFRCIRNTYGSLPQCLLRCLRQRDWFSLRLRLIFLMMKLLGQRQIACAKKLLTDGKFYDCVIGFRPGICTQIAAFACNADKRITWWHHGEINVDHASYLESASTCDRVAVVSEACRVMLQTAFPALKEKLVTVPNLLDPQEIARKAEAFDPYADKTVLHIVSVGRLAPEKHFDNAIHAAKRLKESGIAFQWHLVGDGALKAQLQYAAETAGVADRFLFEGNQPNPYPYMKQADLFVHPSYAESFGIVVAEAMALGVPCVVTRSLGPCEFVNDGVNGALTKQDPESFAESVLEMLSKQELYNRIKANTHCPDRFQPEIVMQELSNLLEDEILCQKEDSRN